MSMFDHCLYFNISLFNRQITKIWEDEFSAVDLPPSHGYLLIAVSKTPDISHKELGLLLGFDPSTITRFLDKLEDKGFIEKSAKWKGAKFKLTPQGKIISQKIDHLMDSLFSKMQKKFGKKEFAKLVQNLELARKSF